MSYSVVGLGPQDHNMYYCVVRVRASGSQYVLLCGGGKRGCAVHQVFLLCQFLQQMMTFQDFRHCPHLSLLLNGTVVLTLFSAWDQ